ncbi:putative lipase atg15 [Mortierella sp. GBA30]|nr:putative lipase atg15 [Mortierella sp. GBA30]
MSRQNSLTFLPLLALYILVLAHFPPTKHAHVVQAHPSSWRNSNSPQARDTNVLLFDQDSRQIPFNSHASHARETNNDPAVLVAGQDLPQETVTLRHVLHHGGVRYPGLFRRRDIDQRDIRASELLTGQSLRHDIKVKTTTTLKPRDQSYRNQGFRTFDMSIGPESWTRQVIPAPDVTDKETVLQLAKINYNAYNEATSPDWYDLEGHWTVNSTFGWEEDGVRGHVFASEDNSTLIIAIKGTTLMGGGNTSTRDKINTILWTVEDMYPGAKIWLTGHSLGGGLSSLLGLTFGVPTVTFQMPGDRLAAQRLHLPMPPAISWDDVPLFHFGHTADPVFQGVCNGPTSTCYLTGFAMESKCHTGRTCVYDTVTEDKWKVDIRTHRMADAIEQVYKVKEHVPECKAEEDCIDCELWQYA